MSNLNTLAVYCGGLDVLSEAVNEEMEGIDEELIEADVWQEIFSKVNEEVRTKIIDALNQRAEITNIRSMFKKMPALLEIGAFNPIFFNFRLPLSLQSSRNIRVISELRTLEAENFQIIYDGMLLMIAAPCSLEERPSGIVDIRDKFTDMLKSIHLSLKTIPPCMTHNAFILTTSKKAKREIDDVCITIKEGTSIIDAMTELYLTMCYPMSRFYHSCTISEEIEELQMKLIETQKSLFIGLKDLETYGWKNFLKKRQTLKKIKTCFLQILEKLAEYPSRVQQLKKELDYVKSLMKEKRTFKEFMEKNNWLEYADIEPLDIQSFTRSIEYAHREIETHSITTSETRAALMGGLAGSITTLVLSYLLGA